MVDPRKTAPCFAERGSVDTHAEAFIKRLFDEMAQTYGLVNMISSLGFAYFWRRRAVRALPGSAHVVADIFHTAGFKVTFARQFFGSATQVIGCRIG
ncbi:MAG: hypothetical protein IAE82_09860 [Opitutaceae bacterium]|nr:hypothetical protein [Opitutaceae bacterium]